MSGIGRLWRVAYVQHRFIHFHHTTHARRGLRLVSQAQAPPQQSQQQVLSRFSVALSSSILPHARPSSSTTPAPNLLQRLLPASLATSLSTAGILPSASSSSSKSSARNMDIGINSFYPLLLDLLTEVSEAHFVSFDLELSGVPSKDSWEKGKGPGKPTLQERYVEVKEAAERYQILQIGLTAVEQNIHDGQYHLRPYNFNLSPVISERLNVERIFSFQSGAVEFLLRTNFDMAAPFTNGVPYMSRLEAKTAREKFKLRQEKTAIADIQIKPTETASLAFLERVRESINAWDKSKNINSPASLTITPLDYETMTDERRQTAELTKYERRLVHQLVRAEYPELVTAPRRGMIQIMRFNKEREDRIIAERQKELDARIARQKGFRWVIEALLGNNIGALDLNLCACDPLTGAPVFVDMDDLKAQFHRAQAKLRGNPKTLIGHNCFLDMVYIYKTFIGDLPDTIEEFQRKLHELFPVIVDTKYMSTHNCGDISPVSSLEQIAQQLSSLETPKLDLDPEHRKYETEEFFHEAGFDSYLTAQVAVRLSAKLEREGAYIDMQDITNVVSKIDLEKESEEKKEEEIDPDTNGETQSQGFVPSEVGGKWKRRGDPSLAPLDQSDPFQYNPKDLKYRHRNLDLVLPDGMPGFKSDFWRVYGNKLRVFGTQEGVCVLDGPGEKADSSEDGGVRV